MRAVIPAIVLLLSAGCAHEYDLLDEPDDPDEPIVEEPEDPVVAGEPVADAGADQEVNPLDTVVLNGIASYDPGGLAITDYKWTIVSQPSGSTATLQDMGGANTKSFFADLAGEYVIDLTVMNDAGIWDSTPDQIVINAIPGDGFYVQASWDTSTDQDLHILRSGAVIWDSPGDCSWCNMNPEWGAPGAADNPSLDWDTIPGFGPETTTIDSPASGSYRIQVHYYGQDGGTDCAGPCPATTVNVDVYIGGVLADSFTGTLNDAGAVWDVATIEWPSQSVIVHDAYSVTYESYCGF